MKVRLRFPYSCLELALASGVLATSACGTDALPAPPTDDATAPAVTRPRARDRFGGEDGAAAMPFPAASGPQVTYQGGKLIQQVQIVQVLYGTGFYIPELTSATAPNMASAYTQLASGGALDWLDEYNTQSPLQSFVRGSYVGSFAISPDPSRNHTLIHEAEIRAELIAQLDGGHVPAPTDNTLYMVHFPAGKSEDHEEPFGDPVLSCTAFCGYHGATQYTRQDHSQQTVYYAVMPDMTDATCAANCGDGTAFQKQTTWSSHEVVEAATDPDAKPGRSPDRTFGWVKVLPTGFQEIVDICEPHHGTFTGSDGNAYTFSQTFSNLSNQCIVARFVWRDRVQNYGGLDFGLPSPWTPITGDFNGDGLTDYARLGATGAWISSYSPVSGTFGSPNFQNYTWYGLNFGLPGTNWPAMTGDFNGDGLTDYARVGATGAFIFNAQLGAANAGFAAPVFHDYFRHGLNFGNPPTSWPIITGDWDGDGKTDYARVGSTGAWVFISNPPAPFGGFNDPEFQTYNGFAFGDPATNWVTITGDFNGDGRTDYARIGATSARVYWADPNSTNAHFAAAKVQDFTRFGFNFGNPPTNWVTITGDFFKDGRTDYIRVGSTGAWVFPADPSNPNGGFANPIFQDYAGLNFGDPATNWQTVTGDFDGDSNLDYARIGSTGAWVFLGFGNGTFRREFQSYHGVSYGDPSPWQVISGVVSLSTFARSGYVRLGGPSAVLYSRDSTLIR